ncbi:Uncharacterised protein [Mycobacteroides abscessus subsp. abscessus]|nr:Uncharacterised protein [Mycobacteroides abscessus subsp. abscessus]
MMFGVTSMSTPGLLGSLASEPLGVNGSYCPRMAPARNARRPPACRPPTFPDSPPPDSPSSSPSSIDRID